MYNKYISGELPDNIKLPDFLTRPESDGCDKKSSIVSPTSAALRLDTEDILIIGLILLLLGEGKEWDIILILAALLFFSRR